MQKGFNVLSIAAAILLAACSSTPKDTAGGVMTSGDVTASSSEMPPSTGGGMAGVDSGTIIPGSEQDLAVNVGDRVFFGYDQYDLNSESRATLEKQAQWLKTYPNVSLMIEGHCDERGTREYNLALGEKRANAVRNYLTALGIEGSRLQTISYGKERPAVMGSDDSSWAQNRRAVAVVQ